MSHPIPTDAELRSVVDAIGTRLRESRDLLVTAESRTGGWIAKTVTDIAGSSDWFDCGMVAYSYEAKQALLGVRAETLEIHGAARRAQTGTASRRAKECRSMLSSVGG